MAARGRSRKAVPPPGSEVLPVFRVRDMRMEPEQGTQREMRWMQLMEAVVLRVALQGKEWEGVQEEDFEVKVRETELSVKCESRAAEGPGQALLESINGRLKRAVNPAACRFGLERDTSNAKADHWVLAVELAKKLPGRAWKDTAIFHNTMFNRRSFAWSPAQTEAVEDTDTSPWCKLAPGLRRDVDDPYVASRGFLCSELENGQTDDMVMFRVILDQKTLDRALEKVPYYKLFGADCSERHFKLFIRGDESSPILLGELGGRVVPDQTLLELTDVTREVEGHRIAGTMETLPCLDVTIVKAEDSQGDWEELITSNEEALNQPQGTLEEFQEQRLRTEREPSPDREDWTPDDWADEQKDKADAAFKVGDFRDAIVYYTRGLRYTPLNEKLLSNRSAAYLKLSKFQLALDDAEKVQQIDPNWSKLYFRKGQALRGLRRFRDAIFAFEEGKEIEPDTSQWDSEIQRTKLAEAALEEKRRSKTER